MPRTPRGLKSPHYGGLCWDPAAVVRGIGGRVDDGVQVSDGGIELGVEQGGDVLGRAGDQLVGRDADARKLLAADRAQVHVRGDGLRGAVTQLAHVGVADAAVGVRADDVGESVLLKRGGEHLGDGAGAVVRQHHRRTEGGERESARQILMDGAGAVAVADDDTLPHEEADGVGIEAAAGVAAQIDDPRRDTLRLEGIERLAEGCGDAAVDEVADPQVADRVLDDLRLDVRRVDALARDGDVERGGLAGTLEGDGDPGVLVAVDELEGAGGAALADVRTVDGDEHVAHADASAVGRAGGDDLGNQRGDAGQFDADTDDAVALALVNEGVAGDGAEEVCMAVLERLGHAADGGVAKLGGVGRLGGDGGVGGAKQLEVGGAVVGETGLVGDLERLFGGALREQRPGAVEDAGRVERLDVLVEQAVVGALDGDDAAIAQQLRVRRGRGGDDGRAGGRRGRRRRLGGGDTTGYDERDQPETENRDDGAPASDGRGRVGHAMRCSRACVASAL